MTESQFQSAIIQFAKLRGWSVYHTHNSRRSEKGFPDLCLVREKVLFREVKTDKGRLSKEQIAWGKRLQEAGADFAIWRPEIKEQIWRELM